MKVFWSNDIQAAIRRTIPDKATVLKIKNQLIDQLRAPNFCRSSFRSIVNIEFKIKRKSQHLYFIIIWHEQTHLYFCKL